MATDKNGSNGLNVLRYNPREGNTLGQECCLKELTLEESVGSTMTHSELFGGLTGMQRQRRGDKAAHQHRITLAAKVQHPGLGFVLERHNPDGRLAILAQYRRVSNGAADPTCAYATLPCQKALAAQETA